MIKLHNAMWPGLVGKGEPGTEPAISLDQMLDLTLAADVEGKKFDGIDFFLFEPHFDIEASESSIRELGESILQRGLKVGTVVAPVWPGTIGASSMATEQDQEKFLRAVQLACRTTKIFRECGVRDYGCIRIDSADSPVNWIASPQENTKKIARTFRKAAMIAADHGEKLAAEGEVCWAGMHSWKDMVDLLEEVDRPEVVGFQADLAHTYLYLLGINADQHRLIDENVNEQEFWEAYRKMVAALGPWTIDFHVAQTDGTVHGSGSHDKTGRHCPANDHRGKLDIVQCARHWLLDENGIIRNNIRHICWDGCMFPNNLLENSETWDAILRVMIEIQTDIERVTSNE